MKLVILISLFLFFSANRVFSQMDCGVELVFTDDSLKNGSLPFSMFSITGVPGKVADEIAVLLTVKSKEFVAMNSDEICEKFKSILTYKKFKLTRIEIREECIGGESGGIFRFVYRK